jgi:hypothetical protein
MAALFEILHARVPGIVHENETNIEKQSNQEGSLRSHHVQGFLLYELDGQVLGDAEIIVNLRNFKQSG